MRPTAPGGLQEKWIIPILREVAEAVFWVHKAGIIHRDIKCANVLITEAGSVQLCDFGVSGIIETRFDKRSTFIGTPHWMAPELFDPSASYVGTLFLRVTVFFIFLFEHLEVFLASDCAVH